MSFSLPEVFARLLTQSIFLDRLQQQTLLPNLRLLVVESNDGCLDVWIGVEPCLIYVVEVGPVTPLSSSKLTQLTQAPFNQLQPRKQRRTRRRELSLSFLCSLLF